MFKAKSIFIYLSAIFVVSLSGCGLWPFSVDASLSSSDSTATVEALKAQSTVSFLETALAQLAATGTVSITSPSNISNVTSTATRVFTATPTQTSTPIPIILPSQTSPPPTSTPSITPTATRTATQVLPTSAPTRTYTPTPLPCNWAQMVADISIPDGTDFKAGIPFTKAWRIKNAGTCTWNEQYDFIYSSGDAMFGPAVIDIRQTVKPGQTVDISIPMISPSREGTYSGYWKIRSHDGVVFGIGDNHNTGIDVKIDVTNRITPVPDASYDFAARYRKATWKTSQDTISPDGPSDYRKGAITISSAPLMEGNRQDDETALILIPDQGASGMIAGEYPAIDIQANDHFRSLLSCGSDKAGCDVIFEIKVSIDGGATTSLKSWPESYDGNFTLVDIDLSTYAGHSVQFTLIVNNNGSSQNDQAVWLAPKIIQVP
jgi:hypothetical protein